MHARERRLGTSLLAAGCLPFAAGALISGTGAGGLPCPFCAATGLPCPLCGATRAFALAADGDGGLWRYNAAWVVFAALAVLAGAIAVAAAATGRAPLSTARTRATAWLCSPARVTAAIALALAIPWLYALAQRATIVTG
jgi:hypothetical protein